MSFGERLRKYREEDLKIKTQKEMANTLGIVWMPTDSLHHN